MLDGPIILFNTYYCIELGYNGYNSWYIIFLFLWFLLISYRIVYYKEKEFPNSGFASFLLSKVKERTYYLFLLGITGFSYFVFHRVTNVVVLVIAFESLHALVRVARNYRITKLTANEQSAESTNHVSVQVLQTDMVN